MRIMIQEVDKKTKSEPVKLKVFADEYGLTLEITQSPIHRDLYTAVFSWTWIKEGPILSGKCGHGRTKEDAVRNYLSLVSFSHLVLEEPHKERVDIQVPQLIYDLNPADLEGEQNEPSNNRK